MLLTEVRPLIHEFEIDGRFFYIDLSFNNVLSVFEVREDKDLTDIDKAQMILFLLTGDELFEDDAFLCHEENIAFAERFIERVFNELILDDKTKEATPVDIAGNPLPQELKPRNFSFFYDSEFIFASFMQAYSIDLFDHHNKMHWDKFIALFNGLPSDTIMMRVIDIRERDIPTGKGSEESARELRKAKARYALPENKEEGGE